MQFVQKISLIAVLSFILFLVVFTTAHASNFTFTKTEIKVDNNATVDNTVHTNANSGSNTTNSNGGNVIVQTGNAGAETIICNDVNHTVINANSGQSCPPGSNAVTPTPVPQPTATPIPGCTSNCGGGSNGGGSSSNNSSSGGSSSGSSTQAVLGMASTGTFTENMMNAIALAGFGFFSLGLIQKMKKVVRGIELTIRY